MVSLSGSNPLCPKLCEEIQNLGEVIYLDVPFEELSKRLRSRPTKDGGLAGEVGYDPSDPKIGISKISSFCANPVYITNLTIQIPSSLFSNIVKVFMNQFAHAESAFLPDRG